MRRPVRRRGNKLERWEIALIKAMIESGRWPNDQDILAYFTRPTRSINHRVIGEIRTGKNHHIVKAATLEDLEGFISTWPDVDPETGLNLTGDELIIKAREAMIAAVQTFNSAGLTFRSELFIVTAIIAWTYLSHAWFKREGVEFRYIKNLGGNKIILKTPGGADKYLDLTQCLKSPEIPYGSPVKQNLEFLLELRHEIEHRTTSRVDEALSAKLQACCINFNDYIKKLFGAQFGLERRLPIALQFVTFGLDQKLSLKKAASLPKHVLTTMDNFERKLSDDEINDPSYAYRVYMVRRTANRLPSADIAVEIVPHGSDLDTRIAVALKEVEKKKYLPSEIVSIMRDEGYAKFNQDSHTKLWKRLDAKNPSKAYGSVAVGKTWCWYENWLERVRAECQENATKYRASS